MSVRFERSLSGCCIVDNENVYMKFEIDLPEYSKEISLESLKKSIHDKFESFLNESMQEFQHRGIK